MAPYFHKKRQDATGTKTVQGRRVEGGEGHGLRKVPWEFFWERLIQETAMILWEIYKLL